MPERMPSCTAPGATIKVNVQGICWEVLLARPEKRNALNAQMRDELWSTLRAARLAGVGVVLRGLGPAFCAGGDLLEFGQTRDTAQAHEIRQLRSVARLIASLSERLVAAVHGACYGAGLELAAFAGTVVCDDTARFCLPEGQLGLIPGAGGTVSVTRRVGRSVTLEMVATGRVLDAHEAVRLGLVDMCLPANQLACRARELVTNTLTPAGFRDAPQRRGL